MFSFYFIGHYEYFHFLLQCSNRKENYVKGLYVVIQRHCQMSWETTALSMLLHEKIAEAKVVHTFPKADCQGQITLMKY